MNKTILAIAVFAAGALTSLASAGEHEHEGPYAGLGVAFASFDCPSGGTCSDDSDTVPVIHAGWMFTENYGAEIGYFAESEIGVSQVQGSACEGCKLGYTTFYLAGVGRLPVGDTFALYGKLGVSFHDVKTTGPFTVTTNDTTANLGAGLEASYDNFAGRLEYTLLSGDANAIGLSVLYRF